MDISNFENAIENLSKEVKDYKEKVMKLAVQSTFQSFIIFHENLRVIKRHKSCPRKM